MKVSETEQVLCRSDSQAQVQVPDLHLSSIYGCKYSGPVWGPLYGKHGSLDGCEAQHGVKAALLPQVDGPVRGAAQEYIRTEWRPFDVVHRALTESEKGFLISNKSNCSKWVTASHNARYCMFFVIVCYGYSVVYLSLLCECSISADGNTDSLVGRRM